MSRPSVVTRMGLVALAFAAGEARGGDDAYAVHIKPLLAARCHACHGVLEQKAGLRLDTVESMLRGGKSGPAVVPGKSSESLLIARVTNADPAERMPPEGEPLEAGEIARLRAWIDAGAPAPPGEQPEADPRDHWAFRSPVRPPVPAARDPAWADNPVDAFVAAKHAELGLVPQPEVDPALLLRRLHIDLVGLPPSLEELDRFVAEPSRAAYEREVDRLLESPHHGERWARHWMDIWRYSDWWGLGAEVRNSQKHMWHWRDWIVESLNADKGYDQMLREMLAADELYPDDLDRLRATGFLARHYFKFNRTTWLDEAIEHTSKAFLGLTFNCGKCHDHKYDPFRQTEYYRLRAFLEPYQVRMDMVPGELDLEKDGIPRAFDCNLDAPTYLFARGDDRNPVKDRPLAPALPGFLAFAELAIEPVTLPPEAHTPGLRPFVVAETVRQAELRIAAAREALAAARRELEKVEKPGDAGARTPVIAAAGAQGAATRDGPAGAGGAPYSVEQARALVAAAEKGLGAAVLEPDAVRARAAADRARWSRDAGADVPALARAAALAERTFAAARAEADLAQAELEALRAAPAKKTEKEKQVQAARDALAAAQKARETPGEAYTPIAGALKTHESNLETEESRQKPFPATSTGRRTALASWLTDRRHPLAARVAVNHVWARHFGRPLVPTVFDFGRKGTPPAHPELLDWLAVELLDSGWSLKRLHRLIVTSRTYRLSSSAARAAAVNRERDPESRFLWRRHPVRMEAQAIRDSLLEIAGELDRTLGGPAIPAADESSRRRSLYFFHSHNEHQKLLSMFDDASVLECYRRAESIVPQQALALANSSLALSLAETIAARVSAVPATSDVTTASDGASFVRTAWRSILCCAPTAGEAAACEEALRRFEALARERNDADPARRARVGLVSSLFNHNDFVTVR